MAGAAGNPSYAFTKKDKKNKSKKRGNSGTRAKKAAGKVAAGRKGGKGGKVPAGRKGKGGGSAGGGK